MMMEGIVSFTPYESSMKSFIVVLRILMVFLFVFVGRGTLLHLDSDCMLKLDQYLNSYNKSN
jgi:hypothetical protein